MRVVRGGPQVAETSWLAVQLIREGVPDEEIVAELKKAEGGVKTLRKAARLASGVPGYPMTRSCELLLAAAGDAPMPVVSEEQRALEAEQLAILFGDPAEGFALLAKRLPALLELERRAREGVPESEWGKVARYAAKRDPSLASTASTMALLQELRSLVGPKSGQSDPLLASPSAASVVSRHLFGDGAGMPSTV